MGLVYWPSLDTRVCCCYHFTVYSGVGRSINMIDFIFSFIWRKVFLYAQLFQIILWYLQTRKLIYWFMVLVARSWISSRSSLTVLWTRRRLDIPIIDKVCYDINLSFNSTHTKSARSREVLSVWVDLQQDNRSRHRQIWLFSQRQPDKWTSALNDQLLATSLLASNLDFE